MTCKMQQIAAREKLTAKMVLKHINNNDKIIRLIIVLCCFRLLPIKRALATQKRGAAFMFGVIHLES
ncbi:MAG TPA: hypothetical protein DCQ76_04545 [Ruminococcaceae bacterium]|nr:hypothetical protein [Oscillospiraceae bacterium]